MTGLPAPSVMGIQNYTVQVFKDIDTDGGGEVDYEEFSTWIKNSDNIQEFLLKYTGVQTFERALKRKDEELAQWMAIFEECAVEFMDDSYTEISMLKKQISQKMHHINKDILEKLYEIMMYDG
jgi:hypothetical protein